MLSHPRNPKQCRRRRTSSSVATLRTLRTTTPSASTDRRARAEDECPQKSKTEKEHPPGARFSLGKVLRQAGAPVLGAEKRCPARTYLAVCFEKAPLSRSRTVPFYFQSHPCALLPLCFFACGLIICRKFGVLSSKTHNKPSWPWAVGRAGCNVL